MKKQLSAKFCILNFSLFLFFMFWTVAILVLSVKYSYWISVVSLAPFFTAILFLDVCLRIARPSWSLFVIYPILEFFVRLIRIDFSSFRKDLIGYSNRLIVENLTKKSRKFKPKDVLVLLPHCIQLGSCQHRITCENIDNCKKCKKCPVSEFIDIRDKYGVLVSVVSGGSSAREMIKLKKPSLIIAIACENDLVSGLRDIRKTPVIAVLNQITSGPCRDTLVDPEIVRLYLESLLEQIPLD